MKSGKHLLTILCAVAAFGCEDVADLGSHVTAVEMSRVDNPYVGATGYVNPEWKANAEAEPGGSRISNNPTGVWLDRIAAIEGGEDKMGLRDHLDEAITQGAGYIQIVIYNLPGRDCAALASNGELGPTEIDRYKSEYIDPIAAIMADPAYAELRIINVIEIDSLPNLITNVSGRAGQTEMCDIMLSNGNYITGIQYALSQLGALPNTYNYVDAGHHGWIGWDSNFDPSADLIAETILGAEGGANTVTGFIVNTANYSALVEPHFTINTSVNGTSVRQSDWVDWNYYVDEESFASAFGQAMSSRLGKTVGMLVDTSRNGWGGPARPTSASTSNDLNTYVNDSRIDRRINSGNWCNQAGAGLGEQPQVVGTNGIHAYVWIKPPGESDGASSEIPNDEGKGFDRMCDPTYQGNARNGNSMSGALSDAPVSGHWFSAQFQELMANAYPPLGDNPDGGNCTTVPSVPSGLTATAASSSAINLSWSSVVPPAGCLVRYNVYRSTINGFTPSSSNLVATGLTSSSYTSSGLSESTTYYFRVEAVDAAGSSVPSAQATATTEEGNSNTAPCDNPITMTNGQSGNLNTVGAVCLRTSHNISGWGCSNFDGRTIAVNNVAVQCGQMPLPSKAADGYYYFAVSGGSFPWASLYYW